MGFGIGINRDLKEVQAMIRPDRKGRGKSIDSEYVIQYLKSNYPNGMGTEAAQIRISTSWKLIYKLYALGLSDSKIGDMVRRFSWDKKRQTFTLLSSKVEELCKERNITEQEPVDVRDTTEFQEFARFMRKNAPKYTSAVRNVIK